MKALAILLAAAVIIGTGAAQAEDPSNKSWSPNLQVPDRKEEPEPEPSLADLKAECGLVSDAAGDPKPGWTHKDLSKAQCRREMRKTMRFLKTWKGNVSVPLVACAVYCNALYEIPFK